MGSSDNPSVGSRSRSQSRSSKKPRSARSNLSQSVHSSLLSKSSHSRSTSDDDRKPHSQRRKERKKLKKERIKQNGGPRKARRKKISAYKDEDDDDDDSSIGTNSVGFNDFVCPPKAVSHGHLLHGSRSNDKEFDAAPGYGDGRARKNLMRRTQSVQSIGFFAEEQEQRPSEELRGDSSFGNLNLFKEEEFSTLNDMSDDQDEHSLNFDQLRQPTPATVSEERNTAFGRQLRRPNSIKHHRRGYQTMEMPSQSLEDDCAQSSSSDSSSHGGGSSSGSSSSSKRKKQKLPPIARREQRQVSRSRWVMVGVLVAVIVVVGACTHWAFSAEDGRTFEKEFMGLADRLVEAATRRAETLRFRLKTMSSTASAMAMAMGGDGSNGAALSNVFRQSSPNPAAPWPFVTLPQLEAWAGKQLEEIFDRNSAVGEEERALMILGVLVREGSKNLWNGYSTQQAPVWIQQSLEYRNASLDDSDDQFSPSSDPDSAFNSSTVYKGQQTGQESNNITGLSSLQEWNVTPYIWRFGEDGTSREQDRLPAAVSAVIWQTTPVVSKMINFNEYSDPIIRSAVNTLLVNRSTVWVEESIQGHPLSKFRDGTAEDTRPYSVILEPIFESVTPSETASASTTAAYFKAVIPWDWFVGNVLDDDTVGPLVVVLENSCVEMGGGSTISFQIDGPSAAAIGPQSNPHSSEFDEQAVTAVMNSGDGCEFSITVYPTQTFRESFQTNRATLYTVVGVLIVFSTAAVFAVYDWLVQRHQQKLLHSARRSNAIVNSLFPENVRERLMDKNSPMIRGSFRKGAKKLSMLSSGSSASGRGEGGFGGNSTASSFAKSFRKPFISITSTSSISGNNKGDRSESGGKSTNSYTGGGEGTNAAAESNEINGGAGILETVYKTKPIADLFPHSTVLFADIVGFTAWSSVRDPIQVFTLLETLYNAFDKIARRRKVFKVETIGDCYVAVTGLPEPMEEHALVMAKFARDCMMKMIQIVRQLEVVLGPDTGDLSMRFGLHSGPVTAGVLRGEKSRFQLFGDTVNTAARIETTGSRGRIHISQDCADLIIAAGKSRWVRPRENKVTAKGKGQLQTYWLEFGGPGSTKSRDSVKSEDIVPNMQEMQESSNSLNVESIVAKFETVEKRNHMTERVTRLVDYNAEVLQKLIKEMIAMRGDTKYLKSARFLDRFSNLQVRNTIGSALGEVKEIISLPSEPTQSNVDPETIQLSQEVKSQLHDFVTTIASCYRNNPFHSFEHASHVTMSVTKLLARIISAESIDYSNISNMKYKKKAATRELHEYSFGITSDPLTRFSVAFAALIHDVDHCGVSNAQLIAEGSEIAKLYKNQSVAEQNSVDMAWGLLMEPNYEELRKCIYTTQAELDRFRQLVVNAVMATDIMDRDLGELRRRRWEKAFSETGSIRSNKNSQSGSSRLSIECANRKATIVIEHLIQASDVAHTMQHWNIYLKWNRNLFFEMYNAYDQGRSQKDPSETWYQGELGFFDFYIIPLARKLKDCGVFGVASDEYLNYAQANRRDWELKGQEVVQDYIASYKRRDAKLEENPNALNTSNSSLLSMLHNTSRRFSMNNAIFK